VIPLRVCCLAWFGTGFSMDSISAAAPATMVCRQVRDLLFLSLSPPPPSVVVVIFLGSFVIVRPREYVPSDFLSARAPSNLRMLFSRRPGPRNVSGRSSQVFPKHDLSQFSAAYTCSLITLRVVPVFSTLSILITAPCLLHSVRSPRSPHSLPLLRSH